MKQGLELMDAEPAVADQNDVRSTRAVPRMLIADDDPAILRLLADRCARIGFQVDVASNGMQAILKASRSKPDILVIDVNMPEMMACRSATIFRMPIKHQQT